MTTPTTITNKNKSLAYILKVNKKAVDHFHKIGVKLVPAKMEGWYYGDPYHGWYDRDIFLVDMPVKGFHTYLKDNGLLLGY